MGTTMVSKTIEIEFPLAIGDIIVDEHFGVRYRVEELFINDVSVTMSSDSARDRVSLPWRAFANARVLETTKGYFGVGWLQRLHISLSDENGGW